MWGFSVTQRSPCYSLSLLDLTSPGLSILWSLLLTCPCSLLCHPASDAGVLKAPLGPTHLLHKHPPICCHADLGHHMPWMCYSTHVHDSWKTGLDSHTPQPPCTLCPSDAPWASSMVHQTHPLSCICGNHPHPPGQYKGHLPHLCTTALPERRFLQT